MKVRNKKTGEIRKARIAKEHLQLWSEGIGWIDYDDLDYLAKYWERYEEPKEFWFVDSGGEVEEATYLTDNDKSSLRSFGNYFETKEEAEKAVEKLKAWKRLKDAGFKFTTYDLYSGSSVKDKTEGEFAIGAECSGFVDNKDLDLLFGGEE